MRTREIPVFFAAVGIISLGAVTLFAPAQGGSQAQVQFQNHSFDVEIANTSQERAEGLMFREELGENEGMLFVYDEEDYRSFWMKNTFIPLDVVFLNSEFEVINIERADPKPNTSTEDLPSYRSDRPAQYVLEINQNRSEEIGLEEGSKMDLGLEFRD